MPVIGGSARLWFLACLSMSACGGDPERVRELPESGPLPTDDASVTPVEDAGDDASESDAGGANDAGDDAGTGDAAPPASDASQPGPTAKCVLDQSSVVLVKSSGISSSSSLAVSMRNEGGTVAWVGRLQNGPLVIDQRWYPIEGTEGQTPPPFTVASTQTEPHSAATTTGHLTVWLDDLAGPLDVRLARMGKDGMRTEQDVRWLTRDEATEYAPVVAAGAEGKALVVWQSQSGTNAPIGRAQLLDASGIPSGSPRDIPSYASLLGRPALARLGAGYVLAWVEASGQVRMQVLDGQGAPVGTSVRVDKSGGAEGRIDLATTTSTGGAVVFDVRVGGQRGEARIRTFDDKGVLNGAETVVGSTDIGLWPSVVAYAGGFVVVYRSVDADGRGVLRLASHGILGAYGGASTAIGIESDNMPTALRISADGQHLTLAWLDQTNSSTTNELRRAWVRCD